MPLCFPSRFLLASRAAAAVAAATLLCAQLPAGAEGLAEKAPKLVTSFTADLLDLKRGNWTFVDALGQNLELRGDALGYAFVDAGSSPLKLACLLCDPEFPDDAAHAEIRVLDPVSATNGAYRFKIDEAFFKAAVDVSASGPGVSLCRLTGVRLGPVAQGDRYLGGLFLVAGGERRAVILAPDNDATGLNPRLFSGRVGSVFTERERVVLSMVAQADRLGASSVAVEMRDHASGERVWTSDFAAAGSGSGLARRDIAIPLARFGVFDVTVKAGSLPACTARICRIPEPKSLDPQDSFMGINIFQQQIWWYAYQAPLMARAGVRWIRPWLTWENAWSMQEPTEGKRDTRALDAALRRMDALGQRYQYILFWSPKWLAGDRQFGTPPPDRIDVWGTYVERLVAAYKDRISCWEVWNEPDGMWAPSNDSAAEYFQMLKTSYTAAKRADPACKILGVSLAGRLGWLAEVCRLGGTKYMDVATIHCYSPPNGAFVSHGEKAKEILGDVPVWLNEFGCSAYDFSPGYSKLTRSSEFTQAARLPALYALSLANDPRSKAFWFCTYDPRDPNIPKPAWDAAIGVLYLGFLPKLSYAALAATARMLDGRACLGRADVGDGGHQVSFAGNVAVIWRDREGGAPVPATRLGCDSDETIAVYDLFANPVASGKAAGIALDFAKGPAFVEGSARMSAVARAESAVKVTPAMLCLEGASASAQIQCASGTPPDVAVPSNLPVRAVLRRTAPTTFALDVSRSEGAGAHFPSGRVALAFRFGAGELGLSSPLTLTRQCVVVLDRGSFSDSMEDLDNWNMERGGRAVCDAAEGHAAPGSLRIEAPFDTRCVYRPSERLAQNGRDWRFAMWVKAKRIDPKSLLTVNLAFFSDSRWLGTYCLASSQTNTVFGKNGGTTENSARIVFDSNAWVRVESTFAANRVPKQANSYALYLDASKGGTGCIWADDLDFWQPSAK